MKFQKLVLPFISLVFAGCLEQQSADGGKQDSAVVDAAESDGINRDVFISMDVRSDGTSDFDVETFDVETIDGFTQIDANRDATPTLDRNSIADVFVVGDTFDSEVRDVPNVIVNSDVLPDSGPVCRAGQVACPPLACVDPQTDIRACGGCNNACSASHGAPACRVGVCAITCARGFGNCDRNAATGCETNINTSPMHCGACNSVCPGSANGAPACVDGGCTFACNPGYRLNGGACSVLPAPRPIAPLSLGDVSLRRPTLRWELPNGTDGASVELCRDRACTMIIETLRVMGSTARPANPLPPRSVVFWRLRGSNGGVLQMTYSPTWLFHVPAADNTGAVDTSSSPHLDLNGDGFDDVAVGAFQASPGGQMSAGSVSVFHGRAMGVAAAPTVVLVGTAAREQFGWSASGAGDLNGDGYGDLIVGATGASPRGLVSAGTASIYYGGPGGVGMAPARVLEGSAAVELFGSVVATAGDVNGDGYAEVLVASSSADAGGMMQAGRANLYHGSSGGIAAFPNTVVEGVALQDFVGSCGATAGDVNGDGYSDVLIGSSKQIGGTNVGTVMLYLGDRLGLTAVPRVLSGAPVGNQFGWSCASAGDVNNDGFSDVVVGAPVAAPGGRRGAGTASIFHGNAMGISLVASQVLEGAMTGDSLGYSVSSARDINGDGYADLVIGGENASRGGQMFVGIANVYHGSAMGIVVAPVQSFEGSPSNSSFGHDVGGLGDLNGDGYADVGISAPSARPGGRVNSGAVEIYHGTMAGIAAAPTRVLTGAAASDLFGWSIASVWNNHTPARVARL